MDALIQVFGFLFEAADLLAHFPHFLDHVGGSVLAGGAQLPDLPAGLVAPGAQFVPPADGLAALGVKIKQSVQMPVLPTGGQGLAYEFGVAAY